MIHADTLRLVPFFRNLPEETLDTIAAEAEIREYRSNEVIVRQHDRALAVYFLMSGAVQFLIRVEGHEDLLVAVGREPGLMIGWSVFRAPFRYTTTTRCEQACRLLRVPHHVYDTIIDNDPGTGLIVLRHVAEVLSQRLVGERDRLAHANPPGRQEGPLFRDQMFEVIGTDAGPVWPLTDDSGPDSVDSVSRFLEHSAFFEFIDRSCLDRIAGQARLVSFEKGAVLFSEGQAAETLFVLVAGSIGLGQVGDSGQVLLRHIRGTGEPLGWSALVDPRRYSVSAAALDPVRVLAIAREDIEKLCAQDKAFGIALYKAVLQVIGSRLRATRIQLVARRYREETVAVRALLDQFAEQIHVTSPLHKIPYLLDNRLTLADAFNALELMRNHGDDIERHIADQCLDILQNVHRELDFYQGLQQAYETVANAEPETPVDELRRRSMLAFAGVFEDTRYRIRGEENLPEQPGNIIIMNHLENHADTMLPNDFRITLDSHFVASMILFPCYGEAPIRVVRKPAEGWYGYQQYFDRLEYIYVYPGDIDEEDSDRHIDRIDRTRLFLETAAGYLRAGRNVVIAPEGHCSYTEDSPGPFRPGAFRLAAYTDPEPLIVPIAVANFDRQLTRVTTSAIVYPPFRLSERVADAGDREQVLYFTDAFQRKFREYVKQAINLAQMDPGIDR